MWARVCVCVYDEKKTTAQDEVKKEENLYYRKAQKCTACRFNTCDLKVQKRKGENILVQSLSRREKGKVISERRTKTIFVFLFLFLELQNNNDFVSLFISFCHVSLPNAFKNMIVQTTTTDTFRACKRICQ